MKLYWENHGGGRFALQKWAERKHKLLIIVPAKLQRSQEMADKFFFAVGDPGSQVVHGLHQ